jgi:hypothetical protein
LIHPNSAGDSVDGPEDAIPLLKPSSRGPLYAAPRMR